MAFQFARTILIAGNLGIFVELPVAVPLPDDGKLVIDRATVPSLLPRGLLGCPGGLLSANELVSHPRLGIEWHSIGNGHRIDGVAAVLPTPSRCPIRPALIRLAEIDLSRFAGERKHPSGNDSHDTHTEQKRYSYSKRPMPNRTRHPYVGQYNPSQRHERTRFRIKLL